MKTSTSLGMCIVHERDAPDDRVLCITYTYVSQACILVICMQGIYIVYERDAPNKYIKTTKSTQRAHS